MLGVGRGVLQLCDLMFGELARLFRLNTIIEMISSQHHGVIHKLSLAGFGRSSPPYSCRKPIFAAVHPVAETLLISRCALPATPSAQTAIVFMFSRVF
jgi:hypothetical protein